MDADDDMPPELVETGNVVIEEGNSIKVPITIVTGRQSHQQLAKFEKIELY